MKIEELGDHLLHDGLNFVTHLGRSTKIKLKSVIRLTKISDVFELSDQSPLKYRGRVT